MNRDISTASKDKQRRLRTRKSQRNKVKIEKHDLQYEQTSCRICLKHGNIPIYGCEDISEDLCGLTGLDIREDDAYPKYLCESCNALFEGAIMLRKTAQESDLMLKQATQDIHTEDIEVHSFNMDAGSTNMNNSDDNDGNNDDDWYETLQTEKLKGVSYVDLFDDYEDNEDSRKRNRARLNESEKDTTTLEDLIHKFNEYKEAKVKFEDVRRKTFHCIKCNMDFNTIEDYSMHRLSAEHDNLRKTCPICNNNYNAVYLKRHLALHKAEKPYMCDVCGKKFAIHGQFNRHRATHFLDELPFKCNLCPYRGRFRENLKIHMRTHNNDKRYRCPQCPTRFFINKSNLNRHTLTHKKDHDFKCDQCQRGFHKKRDLELHFKVDHSGIKDHVCNVCGKAFGFRKQMMKHQRKVHKRDKMRSGRTPLYMLLETKKQNANDESDVQEPSELDTSARNSIDDANNSHNNLMVEIHCEHVE